MFSCLPTFLSYNKNSSDEPSSRTSTQLWVISTLPPWIRWFSLRLLIVFLVQVAKHPATLNFARQAVKVISDARSSNALLSWLVTKALRDPRHGPQISDKAGHPGVISPLSGHIHNGIRSYPSESGEQITGFPRSNLYVESYYADSEAHASSLQASVLKAGKRHGITEQTDLLRSSASPSYVSSPGEDVWCQVRQGDSQH
jgi:hypothetical protein